MVEKNIRGFVLGDDKDLVVENTAKKEQQELQFERLGHRVTLISILIPILIAIIGYFIYADIQKKVTKVHDTGSTEVQTLSKDTDSKFSSLSVQLSKLEESFTERTKALENSISSVKKNIDSVSSKLKSTEANLADLQKTASGLAGKLGPIETNVKEMGSIIAKSEEKLTAAVTEMAAEVGKTKGEITAINSKIETVASSKIDKKELAEGINTLNDSVERSLLSMNKKLNALEEKIAKAATAAQTRSTSVAKKSASPAKEGKEKQTEEVQMIRKKPENPPEEEDFDMLEQNIEE